MILPSPPPVLDVDGDPLPIFLQPLWRRGRRREVPPLRWAFDVSVRLVIPPHGDGYESVPLDDDLPLPLVVAAAALAPARLLGRLGGRAGGRGRGPPGRLLGLLGGLDVHGDHVNLVPGRGRRRRRRQEDGRRWPLKNWWRRRRRRGESEHRWWRRRLDDDWRWRRW